MLSALSDSYLPGMLEHHLDFNMDPSMDSGRRILSPEEALMPPLSMQDRHPSAPQLASMLASSVDNKVSDNMNVEMDVSGSEIFSALWTLMHVLCGTTWMLLQWDPL